MVGGGGVGGGVVVGEKGAMLSRIGDGAGTAHIVVLARAIVFVGVDVLVVVSCREWEHVVDILC